jgi:hypothetical protein
MERLTGKFSLLAGRPVKSRGQGKLLLRFILLAGEDQRLAPFQVQAAPVGRVFLRLRELFQRQVRRAPVFQRIGEMWAFRANSGNSTQTNGLVALFPYRPITRPDYSSESYAMEGCRKHL